MNTAGPDPFDGSHATPEERRTAAELLPMLYADLRRVARRERRRINGAETLQTTALVHEAYLRLQHAPAFNDHAHFLRAAALSMRHALINYLRDEIAAKRGGGAVLEPLDEAIHGDLEGGDRDDEYVVAVHEALKSLGELDPRLEQIVECRFFAGYSVEETAKALALSESTVQRGWVRARAWLRQELKPGP